MVFFLISSMFFFQISSIVSRSTADPLTVLSNRIARSFNRSGATRAVALDISKAFDRVWSSSQT